MKKKLLFWIFRRCVLPKLLQMLLQRVTLFLLKLIEVVLQRLIDDVSVATKRSAAFGLSTSRALPWKQHHLHWYPA
jgi:hypothetical protein